MGIKQLMTLISDQTPQATRETELKNLFGRTIAMDASMALYSFMVAIRPDSQFTLQDDSGEGLARWLVFFFSRHLSTHSDVAPERHLLPHYPHDQARAAAHLGV
jgi:flap endonuclease-1